MCLSQLAIINSNKRGQMPKNNGVECCNDVVAPAECRTIEGISFWYPYL